MDSKTNQDLFKDIFLSLKKECPQSLAGLASEEKKFLLNLPVYDTGFFSLNRILGHSGIPKGKVIEIYGEPGTGKTTLALQMLSQNQYEDKRGNAFIDAEFALNVPYIKTLGVNPDKLILVKPDSGHEAFRAIETLLRSNACNFIVVDSVPSLTPKDDLEKDLGEGQVGKLPQMMSRALPIISKLAEQTGTTVIFINQTRMLIGTYVPTKTTPGGNALKFYSSIRLELTRKEPIKLGDEIVGNVTEIKCVKNKVAPPFKKCQLTMKHGEGFNQLKDLVDVSILYNVIDKRGGWYQWGEEKVQGLDNLMDILISNPSKKSILWKQVNEVIDKLNNVEEILVVNTAIEDIIDG